MTTTDLEHAIERSHTALASILKGDPSGYKALFSNQDDVTLGNPFGPYARGRNDVEKTLDGAASHYRDGEVTGTDLVAMYTSADLSCVGPELGMAGERGRKPDQGNGPVAVARLPGRLRSGHQPHRLSGSIARKLRGTLQGGRCRCLAAAQLRAAGRRLQLPRHLLVGCQRCRGVVPGPAVGFFLPARVGERLVHPLALGERRTRVGS